MHELEPLRPSVQTESRPALLPTPSVQVAPVTTTVNPVRLTLDNRRADQETSDSLLESRDAARGEFKGVRRWIRIATRTLAIASLLAAGGIAYVINQPAVPPAAEAAHANWTQHVNPLRKWNEGRAVKQVRRVDVGGVARFLAGIELATADRDDATSEKVLAALKRNDSDAAMIVIQQAQQISEPSVIPTTPTTSGAAPVPVAPLPVIKPQLSDGLKAEVLRGDASFYHVYLYDSCAQDGDVVELIVDGVTFAVVPITHRGSTLSIPISTVKPTAIQIRGIRDGGGGITVACLTNTGEHFMQVIEEGEIHVLSIVPAK